MKATAFKFGPFELNPGRQELQRRGIRLRLPPSRFRLLVLFVSRPGDLITRDQIAECLWKDEQNVDVMSGINTAVKQLRSQLGDDSATPRYIETVVGAGYRFIARVEEIAEPAKPATDPIQPIPTTAAEDLLSSPAMPVTSTPVGKKTPIAIAIAALLIVAASILFYWQHSTAFSGAAPRADLELAHATSNGDIRSADISPDGKFIAYVRETGGRQSLWVRQLDADRALQLTDLGDDHCPGLAFTPDGAYVYFVRKAEQSPSGVLYRVPFLGGNATTVLSGISGSPAISPDGRKVAFIRSTLATHGEDSVVTAALDGTGERTLITYKAPGIHFNRIAWTPDGATLVYPLQAQLMTIPAEGGVAQPVPGVQWSAIDDLWPLPPGRELIAAGVIRGAVGTQIFTIALPDGATRQITHDLSHFDSVRVTADGKTLLALQDLVLSSLQVIAPASQSEARSISAENQTQDGVMGLAWTPQGKILYESAPDSRGEIWEVEKEGSTPRRVARVDTAQEFADLVASPRGDFIAFSRWSDNDVASIWRMDLNGHDEKQLTNARQDFSPSLTPDGQWVVYNSVQGDKSVLMKVPSQGGAPTRLTDYDADSPSVSPDGLWIACTTHPSQSQAPGLAIVPIAGGPPAKHFQLPDTAVPPPLVWSPDGRSVAFINNIAGVGNIFAQQLAGGPATPVTHFTSGSIFNFQWSRDGHLVLSRGTKTVDAVLIRNFRN